MHFETLILINIVAIIGIPIAIALSIAIWGIIKHKKAGK